MTVNAYTIVGGAKVTQIEFKYPRVHKHKIYNHNRRKLNEYDNYFMYYIYQRYRNLNAK